MAKKAYRSVMNHADCDSIEKQIHKALTNIEHDRASAGIMLDDLQFLLKKDPDKYREVGHMAAKLIEVLQRSNEQLIKIASLKNKEPVELEFSDEEKENIFDELAKEEEEQGEE